MWFGGEKDNGCCERKESLVTEKGAHAREEYTGSPTKRILPQIHCLGKQEGLIVVSFYE